MAFNRSRRLNDFPALDWIRGRIVSALVLTDNRGFSCLSSEIPRADGDHQHIQTKEVTTTIIIIIDLLLVCESHLSTFLHSASGVLLAH